MGNIKGGFLAMVFSILGIILFVSMFGTVMTALTSLRNVSETIVDTTDNVSTAVGVTTANVTLTESLLNGLVANVNSVTSTIGTDVPVADSYTSPILSITGLTANITAGDGRTLITTYSHEVLSVFIAFSTILGIMPTLLLLLGVVSAGYFYYKGYKSLSKSGTDASGLIRMVIGILEIILFVTLFATIVTNFNTLYVAYAADTSWIAFGTVITILPTVLFLAGLFAGGVTTYGGVKARRSRKELREIK